MVGKDLFAVGASLGVGWERYAGDARIGAVAPDGERGSADLDGFVSDRRIYFAGVSLTYLIVQLAAEGGWASGFDAVAGRPQGAYDPSSGSFFLSFGARLTL